MSALPAGLLSTGDSITYKRSLSGEAEVTRIRPCDDDLNAVEVQVFFAERTRQGKLTHSHRWEIFGVDDMVEVTS